MLDRFGVPSCNDRGEGVFGPNGHEWWADADADADLVRRTAAWLRADRDGACEAGLIGERDVRAMTALLDMLATELSCMDPGVRRATVEWCRVALGEADAEPGNA